MSKRKLNLVNNPLFSGPTFQERDRIGTPYREIPIAAIDRDPNQPRVTFDEEKLRELASSIRTYGVLTPILVRLSKTAGRYTLISGERRFRASQIVGLETIPCMIDQDADQSGDRTLAMQLVENLQRADLSPLERAHAIGALKEAHNLSVRDIGERLGVSKSLVQRSLEILDLPDDLMNALREGASESKILLLSKIEDPEVRSSYLKDLDALIRNQLKKDIDKAPSASGIRNAAGKNLSPEDMRITEEIQRSIGLKVRMIKSAPESERGRIVIEFYSSQDLQEVFRKLVAEG